MENYEAIVVILILLMFAGIAICAVLDNFKKTDERDRYRDLFHRSAHMRIIESWERDDYER